MISFRLTIHNQDTFGAIDWNFVPAWSYKLSDNPDKYPIRCNIYQCKELPASDSNGTSDPYVKVWSPFEPNAEEKKDMKTCVVHDNNNPIFYKAIQSFYYSTDYDWSPPVVLDIFDEDTGVFDTDDFIGRAVIFLADAGDAVSRDEKLPKPRWFPVKLGFRDDEPVMGQILASFNVLNPKQKFRRSLKSVKLKPKLEDFEVTINILGLRSLESPGVLPVRKAFVNFNLRSLLPPKKAHAIANISTQPSATGSNPTISTVVQFKITLPTEPLYCPSLTCGVYDYILKGVAQPMIGNFVIPIGDLQTKQKQLFVSEDKITEDIIKALSARLENVEEVKKVLQKRRKEGEQEKRNEEDMKKMLRQKSLLKDRHEMGKDTTPQKLHPGQRTPMDRSGMDSLFEEDNDIEM